MLSDPVAEALGLIHRHPRVKISAVCGRDLNTLFDVEDQASEEFAKTLAGLIWALAMKAEKSENNLRRTTRNWRKITLSCSSMAEWLRGVVD